MTPKQNNSPGFLKKINELKLLLDAPLVYFKIIYAFERVGIKIHQAVITTIGHQVIDTFYIKPSDLEKLRLSDFEEYLKQSLMSPSEI